MYEFDLETLANAFSGLDDDSQAKFFVMVAKRFSDYGPDVIDNQGYYIGSHLRNCECSTPEARELIESIHHGMTVGTHGQKVA